MNSAKIKIITLALVSLLLGTGVRAQVRFAEVDTNGLRELAVRQQKLVFIYMHASWCDYCRRMERNVFSKPEVGDFMESRFVSVRYDIEGRIGAALAHKYDVHGVPTFLIFNVEGELMSTITGGVAPASAFIAAIKKAIREP